MQFPNRSAGEAGGRTGKVFWSRGLYYGKTIGSSIGLGREPWGAVVFGQMDLAGGSRDILPGVIAVSRLVESTMQAKPVSHVKEPSNLRRLVKGGLIKVPMPLKPPLGEGCRGILWSAIAEKFKGGIGAD